MTSSAPKKNSRPKIKKGRTALTKAYYVEKAFARLMALKPEDRDIEMSKYFNDGARE